MAAESLRFVVSEETRAAVTGKSALPLPAVISANQRQIEVNVAALQQQLDSLLGRVTEMLDQLPAKESGFVVDQFKLGLTLNAKGELSIASIAKGEVGAATTFEITLRRA